MVKGSNLSTDKHFVKPRNAQQRGGIIEKERAIDISNVMIICPSCGKATRIAVQVGEDENGKKVKTRVCKKCGESLDKRKSVRATKKKASKTAAKRPLPRRLLPSRATKPARINGGNISGTSKTKSG